MKIILIGALLAASALTATAQQASSPSESVRIPAPQSKIELPARRHYMDRQDFDEFRGAYDLSNGQTLYLTHTGIGMYAEIGHEGAHRIIASSRNSFVALDRQLQVRIDMHGDGTVGGEVTMVVPRRSTASHETEPQLVTFAFR